MSCLSSRLHKCVRNAGDMLESDSKWALKRCEGCSNVTFRAGDKAVYIYVFTLQSLFMCLCNSHIRMYVYVYMYMRVYIYI